MAEVAVAGIIVLVAVAVVALAWAQQKRLAPQGLPEKAGLLTHLCARGDLAKALLAQKTFPHLRATISQS